MSVAAGRIRPLALAAGVLAAVGALVVAGQALRPPGTAPPRADQQLKKKAPPFARDWARFPPVVDRTTTEQVVALGDVHGAYERLVPLLSQAGLVRPQPGGPEKQAWAGGRRTLVCTGDLINKGTQSIEVLELMMSLQAQAAAAGGEVIVTMGNHEAEFLARPALKKGEPFREELVARGLDPREVVAGRHPYGAWILNRPIAARVNRWFFAHAGNAGGATLEEIGAQFRRVVEEGRWRSQFLVGPNSLLEAEKWWRDEEVVKRDARALGVRHIVFGHDPGAARELGHIEERDHGRIFVIDVGMSPAIDYSRGAVLLIDREGDEDVATSLDAAGTRKPLWRGRAAPKASPSSG